MCLLDIIVALFLPSVVGWLFLLVVILVEGAFVSRLTTAKWSYGMAWIAVVLSNLATTTIGQIVFSEQDHLGHLMNWLPVWNYHGHWRFDRMLFVFVISFVGSVIIEAVLNTGLIRNVTVIPRKRIVRATLIANAITYGIAVLVMVYFVVLDQAAFTD